MKIQFISDVHLEFQKNKGQSFFKELKKNLSAETLVVAGDFGTDGELRSGLRTLCAMFKDVVFVAGNHEFYGSDIPTIRRLLTGLSEELSNLHYLDRNLVTIDGQRFIGCTLWFPDRPDNWSYKKQMADFDCISKLDPMVYDENKADTAYLNCTAQQGDVVITHHLPSARSTPQRFESSQINRFFVSPMDEMISTIKPKLWIHGHTHDSCDYVQDETRIVCNPYGYKDVELNEGFDFGSSVDVD